MNVIAPALVWWLAASAIGWIAVPMAHRLLPTLPDRGVAFGRPLGLLLSGYVFWLAATVGILPNSRAGALVAVGVVAAVGAVVAGRNRDELVGFLSARKKLIVGYEVLFLVVLLGWSFYRAMVPNIESAGGEKYMEMAFINAVVESPSFPPLDPWLSGFAISYYYFGYVLAGLLIHLTGLAPSVAFNLVVPLTLAMTVVGAFSLGANLVELMGRPGRTARLFTGAFAATLLPLMGSLIGAVELGYLRGWGPRWFYQWLAIRDLTPDGVCDTSPAPFGSGLTAEGAGRLAGWVPSRFIWWWRGSRVIHDNCREVIHEFPFFSFMLGDVHPHVVTLPYVLLALALALAVLAGALGRFGGRRLWSPSWLAIPLVVGALGFLNAWDLPTFGLMVVLAYGLRVAVSPPRLIPGMRPDGPVLFLGAAMTLFASWRLAPMILTTLRDVPPEAQPLSARVLLALAVAAAALALSYALWTRSVSGDERASRALDVGEFTVWLVALSFLFYLPFYLGFSSQAGGVGFVDIRSRLPQWLVHFGMLWFLAASLAVSLWPLRPRRIRWAWIAIVVLGALTVVSSITASWTSALLAATLLVVTLVADQRWGSAGSETTPAVADGGSDARFIEADAEVGAASPSDAAGGALTHDEVYAASPSGTVGESFAGADPGTDSPPGDRPDRPDRIGRLPIAEMFALSCVGVGLLLPLVVEFVFIRDLFNSRMNTVFKLYYQAWTLLAIGGAVAPLAVWRRWPRPAAAMWAVPAALLFLAGSIYPFSALYTRTGGFHTEGATLDGLAWWEHNYSDDLAAANWLRENTLRGSVIVEAYGGGYEHNGRLSMASGRPTVLGWEGHEHQWRGNRDEIDPRKADIDRMYSTADEQELRTLLDKYDVAYFVVSDLERGKFMLSSSDLERFDRWFPTAYASPTGQVKIFAVQ